MADLDALKESWRQQTGLASEQIEITLSKFQGGSDLLRKRLFHRDLAETIAAMIVLVFFGSGLFAAKDWLSWFGFLIVVFAAVLIPIVLWRARRRPNIDVSSASFVDLVDIEIDVLCRQDQILRKIVWWYLLPIFLGIVMVTLGSRRRDFGAFEVAFITIYLTIVAAICVWIHRQNQLGRQKYLGPLLDHYVQLKESALKADADGSEGKLLDMPDAPLDFLRELPRKPLSATRWWYGIAITICAFLASLAAGVSLAYWFNYRTGVFIASTSPVIAILMVLVTGIWRGKSNIQVD